MAAIGATTPAAGVAGTGVARTRSAHARITANADGNMNMNTDNLNISNNAPPPPPMLTVPTTSNTIASPFDSLEPASAVSISRLWWNIYVDDSFFYQHCDRTPDFCVHVCVQMRPQLDACVKCVQGASKIGTPFKDLSTREKTTKVSPLALHHALKAASQQI
ncbi:hypothetical protein K435DRAFT_860714 [Dendrothele bispora CBS 962.96]|uniref:Uncharacterized protein n=1 Tax=Dendrothele bispora (strain CBS 962.96) TaxID=1314807 RepID=A0A4S8LXL6_DENBC|nr:hypothetical protein K435DRAFT_860714 [Dendrothele bispora CBS 962.96]